MNEENEVVSPAAPAEIPVDVIPDVSENPSDAMPGDAEGGSFFGAGAPTVETVYVAVPEDRPFLTTGFEEYTVTEGLLLLVFLLLVVKSVFDLVGRWF